MANEESSKSSRSISTAADTAPVPSIPDFKDNRNDYAVYFEPRDPNDPQNWSNAKRWYLTLASGLRVLNTMFASPSPPGIFPHLVQEFRMSEKGPYI
ncbi:hypothetical protein BDQ12DRAFT_226980 [Crucibulum laeve]|uniref:Uncharacterized protein n=1 Tax=Crucibulum laeve TaxID=68775 RepID=A0A5C3M6T3_9AGAR|nr:hypothetical protein BDQ12DRAFT_226980 [Crucibulum laeve]